MLQDLRLAYRSLLRRPGYAAACGVSLGLGTGVAFAVLLLVDAILLRPLPLTAPDRVVLVHHHVTYSYGGQGTADTFLYSEFRRVREQAGQVFAAVAGSGTTSVTVVTPSGVEAVNAAFVTAQYFGNGNQKRDLCGHLKRDPPSEVRRGESGTVAPRASPSATGVRQYVNPGPPSQ